METWKAAPVLLVKDIEESVRYYTEKLGFDVVGTFGTPLEMAFVGRSGIQIMLQGMEGHPAPGPNCSYKSVAWDALVWVDDVEALHSALEQSGAAIRKSPYRTFYGHTEMEVLDPDGHVLCFTQAG